MIDSELVMRYNGKLQGTENSMNDWKAAHTAHRELASKIVVDEASHRLSV